MQWLKYLAPEKWNYCTFFDLKVILMQQVSFVESQLLSWLNSEHIVVSKKIKLSWLPKLMQQNGYNFLSIARIHLILAYFSPFSFSIRIIELYWNVNNGRFRFRSYIFPNGALIFMKFSKVIHVSHTIRNIPCHSSCAIKDSIGDWRFTLKSNLKKIPFWFWGAIAYFLTTACIILRSILFDCQFSWLCTLKISGD